ncbi:hypothetical protein LP419_24315 [Massilia sp. H-1]|nr:hypothetical protein LP419_24315 [Massilia sp. H-1]
MQTGGLRRQPAALACLELIVDLGFPIENIFVTDLARRRVQGPHRADGSGQGPLRPGYAAAHPGRDHARRRHLPRPVGRRACSSRTWSSRWRPTR